METLPFELSQRIFSSLSYRHLASAARVCRTWKNLTSKAELWKTLYVQRWGQDKAATVVISMSIANSWKSAYEVEDRRDRIGMELTIVREGDSLYTTQEGLLLRLLGCCTQHAPALKSGSSASSSHTSVQTKMPFHSSQGMHKRKMEDVPSRAGLLDKLLEFVADLHYQNCIRKRARIS